MNATHCLNEACRLVALAMRDPQVEKSTSDAYQCCKDAEDAICTALGILGESESPTTPEPAQEP